MIEVIVSAAVLAMLALAVLSGMDGASRASGREKARSVAATLAEQDQERLRSQQFYTLAALASGAPAVQTFTVDGIDYQVKSQASWQVDSTTGANTCTSQSTNANYLKVTTTVTSKVVGSRVGAVQQDSLVAPSPQYSADHGSLGVKIVDHANAGVPGIAVNATGPGSYNGVTDANGCVIFANIGIGSYTATVNTPGYVDPNGDNPVSTDAEVVSGSTTVALITYDRAASVKVNVETYAPNAANTSVPIASQARTLTDTNGTVVGLGTYPNPDDGLMHSSFTADKLFPFTTPYKFFTGSCADDDPSTYISNYWTQTPAMPGTFQASPGASGSQISVRQPPLLVNLTRYSGGSLTSARNITVTAIPQGSCTDPVITDLKLLTWSWSPTSPTGTVQWGWVGRAMVTAGAQTVPEAGVPFGNYKLCFLDKSVSPNKSLLYPDAISTTTPPYSNTKAIPGITGALKITSTNWKTPGTWTGGIC